MQEKKLIYLAVEGISNTPTARKYGKGATTREIAKYTNLTKIIVDEGLRFLTTWGLIRNSPANRTQWFIQNTPPDNFCWAHGIQRQLGGKCIKCINHEGR